MSNLPEFPPLFDRPQPLTEARIERAVERLMDEADSVLMRGLATQAQYDDWTNRLSKWAGALYAITDNRAA